MPHKTLRCFLYDPIDGHPRRTIYGEYGCKRKPGTCKFAHPDEEDWRYASYTLTVPNGIIEDDPDRDRAPSLDYSDHRRTHSDYRGRPYRSRSRERSFRDRSPRSYSSRRRSPRDHSPTSSIASSRDPRERERVPSSGETRLRRPSEDVSRPPTNHKPSLIDRVEKPPASSSSLRNQSPPKSASSSNLMTITRPVSPRPPAKPAPPAPPPPPPAAVPPPPTPQVRTVPQLPRPVATPKVSKPAAMELSLADKKVAWVERVKLMSEAVLARTECRNLDEQVRKLQRLTDSWRYAQIAEEDKTRLKAQLTEADNHFMEKKKELNSLVARLVDSDFWPVQNRSGAPNLEEVFQNVKADIDGLKSSVTRLNSDLVAVMAKQNKAREATVEEPMEVDDLDGAPSLKRKRPTLEAGVGIAESRKGNDRSSHPEYEKMRDTLTDLESRLSELENRLIQNDAYILEEVDAHIESKMEALNLSDTKPSVANKSLSVQYEKQLQDVSQNVEVTGTQVGELAGEVATLIYQMDALNKDNQSLRQENEALKAKYIKLDGKQQRTDDALKATRQELAAINTVLTGPLSRPPPVPSLEQIVAMAQAPIIAAVREDLEPELLKLRQDIEDLLKSRNEELYTTLWPKLESTLKLVDIIRKWCAGQSGMRLDALPSGSSI